MTHIFNPKSLLAIGVICLVIFISACKKESVAPAAVSNTNTTSTPAAPPVFLSATLGGDLVNVQGTAKYFSDTTATEDEDEDNGCGHGNEDHDSNISIRETGGKWVTTDVTGQQITTTAIIEVKKLAVRVYVAPIKQTNYNMLSPGSFGYSTTTNSGAYVAILDNKGVVWTTNGDQTGSTFQITERGDSTGAYTTFKGVFTAKMYDKHGNVKQITNGAFTSLAGL
ncbi:MAG: hypothetical protein JWO06_1136 [Bacteroidota bacterium]|nr:hypothetical protein [Bacteroidota bacterium]